MRSPVLTVAFLIACCLATPSAFAQESAADKLPPPLSDAPDDLSGHILVAPRIAYLVPMGSAEDGLKQRGFIAAGPEFGLDLAVGISRYVALQGRFGYGTFAEGDDCPPGGGCSARSISFGVGADYHLVNGAAFDPWMRAGIGYRMMSYEFRLPGYTETLDYSGMEWLHMAVGGEWYATQNFGFGPFLALDLGLYGQTPDDATPRPARVRNDTAVHTFFSLGLRVVFDPMR